MDVDKAIHDLAMLQTQLAYIEWFKAAGGKNGISDTSRDQLLHMYTDCVMRLSLKKEEIRELLIKE